MLKPECKSSPCYFSGLNIWAYIFMVVWFLVMNYQRYISISGFLPFPDIVIKAILLLIDVWTDESKVDTWLCHQVTLGKVHNEGMESQFIPFIHLSNLFSFIRLFICSFIYPFCIHSFVHLFSFHLFIHSFSYPFCIH